MRDNPIVMKRILALRQFPIFAGANLDELAMVAENVVERSYVLDEIIAPADYLRSMHLVVDGILGHGTQQIGPRHAHGALEVIAHQPLRAPTIAVTPTRTLELTASDYIECLEDNFGLLLATVRDLAARVIPLRPTRRPIELLVRAAPLGLVERLIILRQQMPFAAARLEALAILAHAARERTWPAGSIVRLANMPADGTLIVLEGSLRSDHSIIGPGESIGTLETLAGVHYQGTYESTTPVRALENHAATILDVLEDHTDFALAIIGTFARALLDDSRTDCASRAMDATNARSSVDANRWRMS